MYLFIKMFLSQSFNHSQLFSELASLEHKKSLKAICISSWLERDCCKVTRSFWRASGPSPKKRARTGTGKIKKNEIITATSWALVRCLCKLCSCSRLGMVRWDRNRKYALDEEMLCNSLQRKGFYLFDHWTIFSGCTHWRFFGLELVLYVWTSQTWCWNTNKNARFRMPFKFQITLNLL